LGEELAQVTKRLEELPQEEQRLVEGYRNMGNFQLRILAANPGCKVEVSHLLT